MVRTLLSLYVRAGVSVANLALRVVVRGADIAADAVRMAVPAAEEPAWTEPADVFVQTPEPKRDVPQDLPQREAQPDLPASPQIDESANRAKTIDDEPELVAEVAEPGAEDGASAEIDVDEPWEGYDHVTADDVIDRIRRADAVELAVVELYERLHKQRRTVLAAAERRQKELANAPS